MDGQGGVVRLQRPALRPRRRAGDRPLAVACCALAPDGDERLLRGAAAGDSAAWEQLVTAHLPAVWSWASEACSDDVAAACTSELVWLRLTQVLGTLPGEQLHDWLLDSVLANARRPGAAGRREGTT